MLFALLSLAVIAELALDLEGLSLMWMGQGPSNVRLHGQDTALEASSGPRFPPRCNNTTEDGDREDLKSTIGYRLNETWPSRHNIPLYNCSLEVVALTREDGVIYSHDASFESTKCRKDAGDVVLAMKMLSWIPTTWPGDASASEVVGFLDEDI